MTQLAIEIETTLFPLLQNVTHDVWLYIVSEHVRGWRLDHDKAWILVTGKVICKWSGGSQQSIGLSWRRKLCQDSTCRGR
ncbi:hypothetical protein K2173_012495 [Erythroxylum novogranatense]|uniref:Uncharacterized protein n=1 Tax=Erythroxylum novogranatense TaxID=1862640 RepID=A0AAV8TJD7_9ROSI|nr:hypothetical protein K2173_012495 [Erythroxylum novogranatense]